MRRELGIRINADHKRGRDPTTSEYSNENERCDETLRVERENTQGALDDRSQSGSFPYMEVRRNRGYGARSLDSGGKRQAEQATNARGSMCRRPRLRAGPCRRTTAGSMQVSARGARPFPLMSYPSRLRRIRSLRACLDAPVMPCAPHRTPWTGSPNRLVHGARSAGHPGRAASIPPWRVARSARRPA